MWSLPGYLSISFDVTNELSKHTPVKSTLPCHCFEKEFFLKKMSQQRIRQIAFCSSVAWFNILMTQLKMNVGWYNWYGDARIQSCRRLTFNKFLDFHKGHYVIVGKHLAKVISWIPLNSADSWQGGQGVSGDRGVPILRVNQIVPWDDSAQNTFDQVHDHPYSYCDK